VLVLSAAAAVLALLGPAASGTAGASTSHRSAPKLAQLGHACFWECPAKTTTLLVAVNTLTLRPGNTLIIGVTVRSNGTSSCNDTAPASATRRGLDRPVPI
jgi:hypothetical protein